MDLPEIDGLEHLVRNLFEVGPTTGDGKLEPVQVRAWEDGTGVELDEFAFSTLLSLSKVYLSMLHEARDPNCPAPFAKETTAAEVANKILARRPKRN